MNNLPKDIIQYLIKPYLSSHDLLKILGLSSIKDLQILRILNIDIRTDNDRIFLLACINGHTNLIQHLIDYYNVDFHRDSESGLNNAVKLSRLNAVKLLVGLGADIHITNESLIRIASVKGYLEVVKFLISQGSNIHIDQNITIKETYQNNQFEVLRYYESIGIDVANILFQHFLIACESGNYGQVKFLVECGVFKYDPRYWSLRIACRSGHLDIVKLLVQSGADVNIRDPIRDCDITNWGAARRKGSSDAFMDAFSKGHYQIAEYLLENGVDIYASCDRGHIASRQYDRTRIKFLVDHGIDPKYGIRYIDSYFCGNILLQLGIV
jgi:hypothetical protein